MHRRESLRLGKRGRPRTAPPPDAAALSAKLYRGAKNAAAHYREVKKRAAKAGRIKNFLVPAEWPADVRAASEEHTLAWQKWIDYDRQKGVLLTDRDVKPLSTIVRFPDRTYTVKTDDLRRGVRLLDVWTTYFAGQMLCASDHWTRMRVGFLHEFGDLLNPPVDRRYKSLARRFRKPQTTIQSYVRSYRRITALRSIS